MCSVLMTSQVRGRHFASHDIRERLDELRSLHEELMMELEKKEKLLQEALSIHNFLCEVTVISCLYCIRAAAPPD